MRYDRERKRYVEIGSKRTTKFHNNEREEEWKINKTWKKCSKYSYTWIISKNNNFVAFLTTIDEEVE